LLTPRERSRTTPGPAHGLAQAAALFPGVSRTGATLAAARALGYDRAEASQLSFGVAGPVLAGATALKAWRGRRDADLKLVGTGTLAAFAGTSAALKLVGLERRRPLWPYAAERVVLAGAILGLRYGRAR
jgi:undecaprenyl-diphosphatase